MSIPKEPRQLMINIMYLVLTALLALNVSAEIFNAFKVVDGGLTQSNDALDVSNDRLPAIIEKGSKRRPELATYAERAPKVQDAAKKLTAKVQEIKTYMIDKTGDGDGSISDGDYVFYDGVKTDKLLGEKDKDITTRYLVEGPNKDGNGEGKALKQLVIDTRKELLAYVDEEDRANFDIPLHMEENGPWDNQRDKAKQSWEGYTFKQMPLQATLPILTKIVNDAKASEAEVLNYLVKKVGTTDDLAFDDYIVISAPKKSYIIKGETYETELSLGAATSGKSNTKVSYSVNGQNLAVKDGKATWKATASGLGKKTYTAKASVFNPVTNETKSYTKKFEYEVGERSVSVSALKMNVFYLGVDNPVGVSAAGVSSNQLKVSMSGGGGCSVVPSGGNYVVKCQRPTKKGEFAYVNVSAPGMTAKSEFRVKMIPDPIAKLGNNKGGSMGNGAFKAQIGLIADLERFDFDARCKIQGFRIVRVARGQDPEIAVNAGGKLTGDGERIKNQAKPGDRFFFENVKAKCPGDAVARSINDLVFTIK